MFDPFEHQEKGRDQKINHQLFRSKSVPNPGFMNSPYDKNSFINPIPQNVNRKPMITIDDILSRDELDLLNGFSDLHSNPEQQEMIDSMKTLSNTISQQYNQISNSIDKWAQHLIQISITLLDYKKLQGSQLTYDSETFQQFSDISVKDIIEGITSSN